MATTVVRPSVQPASRGQLADPAYQAFALLRLGFTVAPIVAGADKFLGLLVDWDQYLAPWIAGLSPIGGHNLMLAVGAVEVVAGLALFGRRYRDRVGLAVAAYFVLVFPANVYVAVAGGEASLPGLLDASWYPWVRLPFQALFVWWALRSTGAVAPRPDAVRGPQPAAVAR